MGHPLNSEYGRIPSREQTAGEAIDLFGGVVGMWLLRGLQGLLCIVLA